MKTWTPEDIVKVLEKNDEQVCRALVLLYDRQTEDEKRDRDTKHSNGVGFNGADSKMLSSFAQQYLKKHYLTDKQISYARKRILKYSKQLTQIANAK